MGEEQASRDRIVAAARSIVETDGVEALSMRKVAAEVGLAPTAIYWHLGSREDLLHAVLDTLIVDLAPIDAEGENPRDRISSVVHAARQAYLDGIRTLQLANEVGRGAELSLRSQVALARELTGAGLRGEAGAVALRSLLFLIGGFVMIEDQYRQGEPDEFRTHHLWADLEEPGVDPAMRAAMAGPTDTDELFDYTLDLMLDAVLGPS